MNTTPDGRPIPPAQADERAMLDAWLDFHRATAKNPHPERVRRSALQPPARDQHKYATAHPRQHL